MSPIGHLFSSKNRRKNLVKNHPLVFQHVEGVDSGIEACRRRICNESYERLKAESPPKKNQKSHPTFDPCSRKAPDFWLPWCFLKNYVATSCGHWKITSLPSLNKDSFFWLSGEGHENSWSRCKGCFLPHLRRVELRWKGFLHFDLLIWQMKYKLQFRINPFRA